MLITNTFNITMAVFDVAQHVISAASGIIGGSTAVDSAECFEDPLEEDVYKRQGRHIPGGLFAGGVCHDTECLGICDHPYRGADSDIHSLL